MAGTLVGLMYRSGVLVWVKRQRVTQQATEGILEVYFSKNNDALNGMDFQPELINGCVMVNPHYPVSVLPRTKIVMDSGAFQERDMIHRLSPRQALDRQRAVAKTDHLR